MNPILGINNFGCNTTAQNHLIKNCRTNTMNHSWIFPRARAFMHWREWNWGLHLMSGEPACISALLGWRTCESATSSRITYMYLNFHDFECLNWDLPLEWVSIKYNTCAIVPTRIIMLKDPTCHINKRKLNSPKLNNPCHCHFNPFKDCHVSTYTLKKKKKSLSRHYIAW